LSEGHQDRRSWIVAVRERLANPPPRRLAPRPPAPGAGKTAEERWAAVLVPLFVDAGELWTLLTRRAEPLPHHKGQIAFPGGEREPGEDPWAAALRESEEEVGLESRRVLKLGELDEAETPSGFRIVPCVAAIPFPFTPRANTNEIAEVFSLPLSGFANPRAVEDQEVMIDGAARWIRVYHVGGRRVWGLTARILQNLLDRLEVEGPLAG
jgi:8-oxo-dGTP pyrophosphatase MutT (NUDIX family)